MLGNHIRISLRKILKDGIFSIIKILSLAISMACSIFIFLWVQDELTFDKFHPDFDRVYRVYEEIDPGPNSRIFGPICGPVGAAIRDDFPQVEHIARTYVWGSYLFNYNENLFFEEGVVIAEPDILKIFKIPFIIGDPEAALTEPNTLVLTETIAKKYFGDENPVGKVIDVDSNPYTVTGIVEDCPSNTVFQYEILISFETFADHYRWTNWFNTVSYVFLKMKENVDFDAVSDGIEKISGKYLESDGETFSRKFYLEPIADLYFNTPHKFDLPHGNKIYVYIMSAIGILILLIGIFNFMNLSTSKFAVQFREIAMRKIAGGSKRSIAMQSLIESIILSFIALNIALYTIEILLTPFNDFIHRNLDISYFDNWYVMPLLLTLAILIGLISGIYPAFALSIIKPLDAFRDKIPKFSFNVLLRKILVVFQFTISIALIITATVIFKQVDFMINKDLNFEKENKLVLPVKGNTSIEENYRELKELFSNHSVVNKVSVASNGIGAGVSTAAIGIGEWNDITDRSMNYMFIDADFLDVFDIDVIAGRNFNPEIITDISSWDIRENGGLLLNKAAVDAIGWTPEEAVGKELLTGMGGRELKVIGVMENFHYFGLQYNIEPMVMEYFPNFYSSIILDINPGSYKEAISFAEKTWNEQFPDLPLEYYFVDEYFKRNYFTEQKVGTLVGTFTIFAIIVACLGLYGLTLYTTEQKTKEIGIRKALGASISEIIQNSSKQFIILVVLSNIIAWPLAYFALNKWLENFHYNISIPLWIFIIAGILVILIAQLTITLQAWKAANKNPVEALRYE